MIVNRKVGEIARYLRCKFSNFPASDSDAHYYQDACDLLAFIKKQEEIEPMDDEIAKAIEEELMHLENLVVGMRYRQVGGTLLQDFGNNEARCYTAIIKAIRLLQNWQPPAPPKP